jgi:hypothetical protein
MKKAIIASIDNLLIINHKKQQLHNIIKIKNQTSEFLPQDQEQQS